MTAVPTAADHAAGHSIAASDHQPRRSAGRGGSITPSTISVRTRREGIVIVVDGRFDERGADLLDEVLQAALAAVGRPHRIDVDMSHALVAGRPQSPTLRHLQRTGATVTWPPAGVAPGGAA